MYAKEIGRFHMKGKSLVIGLLVILLACGGCSNKNRLESANEGTDTITQKVETAEGEEAGTTGDQEADDSSGQSNTTSDEQTTANATEEEGDGTEVIAGNLVDVNEAPTDSMLNRSVTNEGNLARLALAMQKSQAGEEVTIAFIGGSITQGSSASAENQYVTQVTKWWEENLGEVNCINAGVGATDSYLGVHRLDRDVLSDNPDVIFVEFAVNDTDKVFHKYTYDSLLLKCLKAENSPAVVLLMMTQEDGTSLEEVHSKLGTYYDLPVLSYRSMIYPEVAAGNITWSDISPDNIHPNDIGHTILARMITHYLEDVKGKLTSIDTTKTELTVENYSDFAYENARLVNRESQDATKVQDEGSFTENVSFQTFENGWGTKTGGSITFEVEARNFGVLFKKDVSGSYGKAEIYIDGELFGFINGNFQGGWGNYIEGYQVFSRSTIEKHTIEIRVPEGTSFDIISLLIS